MAQGRQDAVSSADAGDENELVTGEAVGLDVRPASVILRAAGTIIDCAAYLALSALLALALWWAGPMAADPAIARTLMVVAFVFAILIVPMLVETATGGRSLGKLAIGARIVRDDGGAIQLRHAFVRALLGVVEIFMTFGGLAAMTGLLNGKSKRMGDILAGTYSQHERVPQATDAVFGVPADLTEWAATADVAKLPDALARRIVQFLRQAGKQTPATRARIADSLAAEAAVFVSPVPAVPAETFLAGVAAVRREREYAALLLERERLERLRPVLGGLPNGFPDR